MKIIFQILIFSSFIVNGHFTSVSERGTQIEDPCNENLIGTECNDWDACTIDDRYNTNCECEGIYLDTDNDGVCDADDLCDGSDDGYDEDNDTIPDGCDDCNNNDANNICTLPDPCNSIGGDSSFEYINQVTIGSINNISGNNDGYNDFRDQILEVKRGSLHEIILVPGYASGLYKEAWNIWIDFNKDGEFDNEKEKVLSRTQQGTITSTILIPLNPVSLGVTRMRISMQYNNDAEPCKDVTFGEVEDYYINIMPSIENNPCRQLSNDDFDLGYGEWEDGGSDCSRIQNDEDSYNWSIRLRDNSSTSTLTSHTLDLSLYDELEVDFQFIANSMELDEDFWFQISLDDGATYSTVKSWSSGREFDNGKEYKENISIKNKKLTDKVRIRWKCDATANADQVFLDNISVTACVKHDQENNSELLAQVEIATANETQFRSNPRKQKKKLSFGLNTYPNPATDNVSVKFSESLINIEQGLNVQLINMFGESINRIAISKEKEEYTFDVSQLESGMYMITLNNDYEIIESRKVMIVKY